MSTHDAACLCPHCSGPDLFANQFEQDNEEACDALDRVDAERDAYFDEIDAQVDEEVRLIRECMES